jgi:hypothetical protein
MDPSTIMAIGSAFKASGEFMAAGEYERQGSQTGAAADFMAKQLRQKAGQAQAGSQREAYNIDRESQYIASSALAAAAASGGGASDPTVMNLIARNAGEFAYRKSVALYKGDDEARSLNLQADVKQYEGEMARVAGKKAADAQMMKGFSSILSGSSKNASLLQRFGGDGPGEGVNNSAGTIYTGNLG